jgi:CheY-like chemotaxis protein
VVDDAAVNRDIAASFLRSAGHHVSCAESGAKAVAMAAETIFDVVLMDLRMPQMDGLEASRRIRALGGAHGAVPIVALTAQAFTQHVEECRQAGMDYHLAKPFNQAALLNIVAKARANRDPDRVFEAIAQDSGELNMGESAVLFGAELPIINRTVYSETSKFLSANNLAASIGALINRTSALVQDLGATPLDAEQVAVAARSIAGSAAMFGFQRLAAAGQRLDYVIQHQRDQLPLVVESLKIAAAMSLEEMRNLTVTEHQT